jgi:DNA ligase D-like protein (predicted 3'-phosphoesterase)
VEGDPIFVVQEHHARTLHWDFRLEMDGVLKSWAVPKGPPVKPGVRRLAIQVDDHDMEYADFEGTIEEGEYGAGRVIIWDRGTYRLWKREEGLIDFTLEGNRLKGNYALVRWKGRQWLLIKKA